LAVGGAKQLGAYVLPTQVVAREKPGFLEKDRAARLGALLTIDGDFGL
jgi:hypothetical protein